MCINNKNSNRLIVKSEVDADKFMESVVGRTILFLADEAFIKADNVTYGLTDVQKLQLKELTSIITVEDDAKMTLAFTYDKELIKEIFSGYSQGIVIDEGEEDLFIEETAGDMINIVLGNVLAEFQQPGRAFALSAPIIVNEAKSIARYRDHKFYSAELTTGSGTMSIFCITPGEPFRNQIVTRQGRN